jgi:uncharacterized membrane protein
MTQMVEQTDRQTVKPGKPDSLFGAERLIALSDGVFAIAITLLVLDLRLPDMAATVSQGEFAAALARVLPAVMGNAVSFTVIGMFWLAHHRLMRFMESVNMRFAVLNLLLLFWIAMLPFPTRVLWQYAPQQQGAVILYAANMAAAGLTITLLYWYAGHHRALLHDIITPRQLRKLLVLSLLVPVVFLLSIGIAFVNTEVAMFFWLTTLVGRMALVRVLKI